MQSESIEEQLFSFRNCVCEATLACSFPNLLVPAMMTQGRCEPQLFPASVARLKQTGCTVSIFAAGRAMVMGSSSEFNSRLALILLCDHINTILPWIHCRVTKFHVVNRVASVKLGVDLDIEKLASDWKWSGLWERQSFPGPPT